VKKRLGTVVEPEVGVQPPPEAVVLLRQVTSDRGDDHLEPQIDILDVFRRSEFVPEIVDEAIRLKVPAIWLQEGVIHQQAAEKARKAGIQVVMDRCILKEHRARFA